MRTGVATATATVLTALALAALAAGTAQAAGLPPAAKRVARCSKDADRLLVVMAIDSSASLRESDPDDDRAAGIGAALSGLAKLAERAERRGSSLRVEVLLTNFAGSVQPRRRAAGWQPIDAGSRGRLRGEAERYRGRDHGRDTDYVLALRAARSALRERVASGDGAACTMIVFFSDGGYEIGDRSGAAHLPRSVPYAPSIDLDDPRAGRRAVAIGRRLLCRSGGLMDEIVTEKTVLFTVGLIGPRFRAADLDRLEAMTTGRAGGRRCGSKLSAATGEFIAARDSRELFYIFRGLLDGDQRPPDCYGNCPNPSTFSAEAGLSGFELSTSGLPAGARLELTDPTGQARTFGSGAGAGVVGFAGATVRQLPLPTGSLEVVARFDRGDRRWTGTWRFELDAPGEVPIPSYDLVFQTSLRPVIEAPPALIEGTTKTVAVRLRDGDRPAAGVGLVRSARLRAAVVDGSGAARPVEVRRSGLDEFRVPVSVGSEVASGDWTLETETYFATKGRSVEGGLVGLELGEPQPPGSPRPPWLAIAAGVLALLAIALLIDRRRRVAAARFVRADRLRAFSCEAAVGPGARVTLNPDPGRLDYNAFDWLVPPRTGGTAATLDPPPFAFRAHVPWRFRGRVRARVTATGDLLLLGGGTDGPLRGPEDGSRLAVPLDLAGIWLFAFEPPGEAGDAATVEGRLVVIVEEGSSAALGDELLAAARRALAAQDWEAFRRPAEDGDDWDDRRDLDEEFGWESI